MIAPLLLLLWLVEPADDLKAEVARHQGTWNATSFMRDGKPSPQELVDVIVRVVEGDHVVWKRAGKSFAGTTFELDPTRAPKSIDLIPDGGPMRGEHVLGIYKWEGDTLVICTADAGAPRPTSFEAAEGSRKTLMTFRRRIEPSK